MFFVVILSIWTAAHAYVIWRAAPVLSTFLALRWVIAGAVLLWAAYPLARWLASLGADVPSRVVENIGARWIGLMFLATVALLLADVLTGFGVVLPRASLPARAAALAVAVLLALIATGQAARPPAVIEEEVRLAGLPRELDGAVLVEISDLHLGGILGPRWFERRVAQILALKPDLVLVVGDLVDGNVQRMTQFLPAMRRLTTAPLGVFAVTGNHEYYAGRERSIAVLEDAGYTVLQDSAALVRPGLVLAGVDDLTARSQFRRPGDHPERAPATALTGRPPGATVYLCHSPWQAEDAARLGAGLMLCGHTHDGQIWPFKYTVTPIYPLIGGRYDVEGMPVIVCRGTGTWGPRMRLWRRSEIVRITLRSA